ncbi:MAG: hypothetical protein HGB06_03040 [Chlorobaculum sp.]|jgi:hypothetical protein|nr:hypothetical protein [Chlorobaculum sp.]
MIHHSLETSIEQAAGKRQVEVATADFSDQSRAIQVRDNDLFTKNKNTQCNKKSANGCMIP